MGQESVIKDSQPKDKDIAAIACDFGQSLFHSAIESPINGVTQLVNEVAGTKIGTLSLVGAPSESTSTADKYAQEIGGAIGMVVPYFLVSKGVGKASEGLAGTSLASSLSLTPFLESSIGKAGISGAIYGGVFNPVADNENNPFLARLRNGAVDGATFATLTGTSEALAKQGIFKPTNSALATTVAGISSNTFKEIGANIVAGVPAGLVSAEGQSVLAQGRLATGSELRQSAVDFATIGGALTVLTHGVGAAQTSFKAYRASDAATSTAGASTAGASTEANPTAAEPTVFKPGATTFPTAFFGLHGAVEPVGSPGPSAVLERAFIADPVEHDRSSSPSEGPKWLTPTEGKAEGTERTAPRGASPEAEDRATPPGGIMPEGGGTVLVRIFDQQGRLTSNLYPEGAKKLALGKSEKVLIPGGDFVPIGREDIDVNNNNISRSNHAWLGIDNEGALQVVTDAKHEVSVKRKGTDNWQDLRVVGSKDNAGFSRTRIDYGDQVRIGATRASDKGSNLDLSSIAKAKFSIGNKQFMLSPGESEMLGRDDLLDWQGQKDAFMSNKHLSVGIDQDGRAYVMENPAAKSTNGTWLQRKGSATEVKINPGDKVHVYAGDMVRIGRTNLNLDSLYSEVGPAVIQSAARGKNLAIGNAQGNWVPIDTASTVFRNSGGSLYYRDARGEVFEAPDGTKSIQDASNAMIQEQGGRITGMTDAVGHSYGYAYGDNGSVNAITFPNGEVYRSGGGVELSVDPDGAFHWKNGADERVFNPDGSVERTVSNLPGSGQRFQVENASEKVEKQKISNLARQQLDNGQFARFQKHMAEFENRMPDQQQRAVAYHELNRLLADNPDSLMSQSERNLIAEQTMWQLARPQEIDQGGRPTCNVTTVEKKTAFEHPSEYARLIADVANSGKYTTSEGWIVDVGDNNVLKADDMALRSLNNPFDPVNNIDLKDPGKRSWASKIFQETAVESHWSRRTWDDAGNPVGARWARFADRGGHEALVDFGPAGGKTMLGIDRKPLRSPYLHGDYLEDISRQITGAPHTDFYFTKGKIYDPPAASGVEAPKATGIQISSQSGKGQSELAGRLVALTEGRNGQPPQMAIVKVDCAKEPFFTDSGLKAHQKAKGGALDADNKPGKHVVLIKSIDTTQALNPSTGVWDPNRVKVEMLNSWGRENDHVIDPVTGRDNRITLQQLWEAMN